MEPHYPHMPVGGCLRFFIKRWREITSDPSILDIVSGMHISLTELPRQSRFPKNFHLSQDEINAGNEHIQLLLDKKAIVHADNHIPGEFFSNVFLIPKRDSGFRMILNLKQFNQYVEYLHFKMDTLNHILSYVTFHCFMAIFDFNDAYLSVSISGEHVKFLKFTWQGRTYMYVVLPFGISSAPRKFTKLLKPILSVLKKRGIIVLLYIDDGFTVADTFQRCYDNIINIMKTCSFYGFIINKKKSAPVPSTQVRSLGFYINSISMHVTLPADKIESALLLCHSAIHQQTITIAVLAQLIGTLISLFPACPLGKLHYRSLERLKVDALRKNRGDFNAFCTLDDLSISDISWWIDTIPVTAAPIHRQNPSDVIFTDSSDYAWLGYFRDVTAHTFFTADECSNIIAFKELLAIYYSL